MKTIFLDFDGVLHPTSATPEQVLCRLPTLEQALHGHSCEIVISSSWRHHHSFNALLKMFSFPMRGRVAAATGEPYIGKWARYHEILNYCRLNRVTDWVALDDSFLEFPKPCKELILCNPNIGIGAPQLESLDRWLNAKATNGK